MRIEVVAKAPAAKADTVCRFEALDAKPAPKEKGKKPRSLTLLADDGRVGLRVHVAAFKNLEPDEARRVAGGATIAHAAEAEAAHLLWELDRGIVVEHFRELLWGALLASYRFEAFKGKKRTGPRKPVRLTIVAGADAALLRKEAARIETINEGVVFARDLTNMPANELAPRDLAAYARKMAAKDGLAYSELGVRELARKGYVGLCAVGRGSANPPVMFVLRYRPKGKGRAGPPLCLVGKGLTFDSGGISIKPSEGMWEMKGDMGGCAAVIGAMHAIAKLGPRVDVVGVCAAAENLPDGNAYRPGDILRFRNGRTVEIRSTDAEGRLALADALLFAQEKLGQRRIVEFSTLTGACMRALGTQFTGLMSRSSDLAQAVRDAARAAGEPVWELPMHPEYRGCIDSPIADIHNTGGKYAGAQAAAWFLHEFIQEGTEYVHLDIAGTFLAEKEHKYWSQAGATGVGVRLAVALAAR